MNQPNLHFNGLIRYSCSHISGPMNQFMPNLVCEGFHHVLLKYGHENLEMHKRKFDDITLQYSIGLYPNILLISTTSTGWLRIFILKHKLIFPKFITSIYPKRGQNKSGPWAKCPLNLVLVHKTLISRPQMALENVADFDPYFNTWCMKHIRKKKKICPGK